MKVNLEELEMLSRSIGVKQDVNLEMSVECGIHNDKFHVKDVNGRHYWVYPDDVIRFLKLANYLPDLLHEIGSSRRLVEWLEGMDTSMVKDDRWRMAVDEQIDAILSEYKKSLSE